MRHWTPAFCAALVTTGLSLTAREARADAPANDDIANATVINSLPFTDALDTSEATTAPGDPSCAGNGPTVWYEFTSPATTNLAIDVNTFGSGFDTTVSVYESDNGTLVQLACNDDTGSLQSQVRLLAEAGRTYFVMVGSFSSGPGGPLSFSVQEISPPPNDNLGDAAEIGSLPFRDTVDTAVATIEAGDPQFCSVPLDTVWYEFTPAEAVTIIAQTLSLGFLHPLAVFASTPGGLSPIAAGCGNRQFAELEAGQQYFIVVGSFPGEAEFVTLDLAEGFNFEVAISSATVSRVSGRATVVGTATCSTPGFVEISGSLRQRLGKQIVEASNGTGLPCSPSPTPWQLTFSAPSAFLAGRAELDLVSFGCGNFDCVSKDPTPTTIQLR
jgi:hypothetical protein